MADNQKNILQDMETNERFLRLLNNFSTTIWKNGTNEVGLLPKLGIFSKLLALPDFQLYDNEFLVKKFPEGFVTETMIGIPLKSFLDLRELFSETRKQFTLADFITSYMGAFIEKNLGVEINQKDKEVILSEYVSKYLNSPSFDNHSMKINPNKSSNLEVKELLKNDNYNISSKLDSTFNKREFLDILIDNKEYAAKVPSLLNIIENQKYRRTTINENISIEDFKDMINGNNTIQPIRIVLKKINKLKKETNGDLNIFLKLAKNYISPFISVLPQLQFNMALLELSDKVLNEKKETFSMNNDAIVVFLEDFNKKIKKDPIKNNQLIEIVSGYHAIRSYDFRTSKEINEDEKIKKKSPLYKKYYK